jgi:hypothetical protein
MAVQLSRIDRAMLAATPEQWRAMMNNLKALIYSHGGKITKAKLLRESGDRDLALAVLLEEPDTFRLGEQYVKLAWMPSATGVSNAAPKPRPPYKRSPSPLTLKKIADFKSLVLQCQQEKRFLSEGALCRAIGAQTGWLTTNVWKANGKSGYDAATYAWALELRELADTLIPYCQSDKRRILKLKLRERQRSA